MLARFVETQGTAAVLLDPFRLADELAVISIARVIAQPSPRRLCKRIRCRNTFRALRGVRGPFRFLRDVDARERSAIDAQLADGASEPLRQRGICTNKQVVSPSFQHPRKREVVDDA